MRQGFTLWFDPDGGKEKTFGIKFPIGRQARGIAIEMREVEPDLERFREAFERSLTELEILGPGEDVRKKMPVKEAKGIEIDVEASSGMPGGGGRIGGGGRGGMGGMRGGRRPQMPSGLKVWVAVQLASDNN